MDRYDFLYHKEMEMTTLRDLHLKYNGPIPRDELYHAINGNRYNPVASRIADLERLAAGNDGHREWYLEQIAILKGER